MTRSQTYLHRFLKDTRGTVAIEAVIALPVLFWALMSSFVFFDAYRQNSINIKAAYMVGDMLSRETNSVDDEYLNGMMSLFEYLAGTTRDTRLRVSVVEWDEQRDAYSLDWSQVRGSVSALSGDSLSALESQLPVMSDNERVIVVETWSKYEPPFSVGLGTQDLYNFVVTSPRFAPLLQWNLDPNDLIF